MLPGMDDEAPKAETKPTSAPKAKFVQLLDVSSRQRLFGLDDRGRIWTSGPGYTSPLVLVHDEPLDPEETP
jgi:hypothetical protein